MNHHKWLYRTRSVMNEVQTSMNNLADYITKSNATPTLFYDGHVDINIITRRRGELQTRLRECLYSIIDLWPEILSNEARRYEIGNFLSRYRTFRHALHDLYEASTEHPAITKTALPLTEIASRYRDYILELDEDMALILKEFSDYSHIGSANRPDLSGIARRLGFYIKDTDEEFYERLIIDRHLPAKPLKWHGSKVASGLFARHFALTDSEMNRAFVFNSHGRTYRGLKSPVT